MTNIPRTEIFALQKVVGALGDAIVEKGKTTPCGQEFDEAFGALREVAEKLVSMDAFLLGGIQQHCREPLRQLVADLSEMNAELNKGSWQPVGAKLWLVVGEARKLIKERLCDDLRRVIISAARLNQSTTLRELVNNGADIDVVGRDGKTALEYFALPNPEFPRFRLPAVEALLGVGAKIPEDLLARSSFPDVRAHLEAEVLRRATAKAVARPRISRCA